MLSIMATLGFISERNKKNSPGFLCCVETENPVPSGQSCDNNLSQSEI
jgi:hypothetical protein